MDTSNGLRNNKEFIDTLKTKLGVKEIEKENVLTELKEEFGLEPDLDIIQEIIDKESTSVSGLTEQITSLEEEIRVDIKKHE